MPLSDGVGRNGDDLVVEALVALAVGVVVHAVEEEIIEHAALAVDVVGAGAYKAVDGAGRSRSRSLTRAGDQGQEIRIVAAYQRQRRTLILCNDLAALAGLCFELQLNIVDFNGFLRLPDLQSKVDALATADR